MAEKILSDRTVTLQELGITEDRPIFPYDLTAQLNALPLYNTCEGLDSQLDLARTLILSEDFFYQAFPFPVIPEGQTFSIAAFGTASGTIAIPPNSFLWGITHFTNQPEGFQVSVYDKGAKVDLFYNKFVKDVVASSPMGVSGPNPSTISTQEKEIFAAQGPRFMVSPTIILPPGAIQVEMTNLSSSDNLCQICFHFAVPFGPKATNIVTIQGGN
jgi:hypothetical protein